MIEDLHAVRDVPPKSESGDRVVDGAEGQIGRVGQPRRTEQDDAEERQAHDHQSSAGASPARGNQARPGIHAAKFIRQNDLWVTAA